MNARLGIRALAPPTGSSSGSKRTRRNAATVYGDLTFGPDGYLYVVEFDENGWLAATSGDLGLGTINRCDVTNGSCSVVEGGLVLPAAIDFDKRGDLWLLENPFAPTVRRVD